MKSTTTRLAASVLAIAIPFVPTAAHAEHNSEHGTRDYSAEAALHSATHLVQSQLAQSQLDQTHPAQAPFSASPASAHVTAETKAALSSAIESVHAAAQHAINYHNALQSAELDAHNYVAELAEQAETALDAAYAEIQYARTNIPSAATTLLTTVDAIIADLNTLRGAQHKN